jgi:SAM-dependent methyltransferase
MVAIQKERSDAVAASAEQAIFQVQWQIYHKMVTENYLFHREAYAILHRVLQEEAPRPFGFLDVACGDASASAAALQGTSVGRYFGIDSSRLALSLAATSLAGLACPVTLVEDDFVEALAEWDEPVDVVWIGLSLHHQRYDGKLQVMSSVRRLLGEGGLFLVFENASPDGETREQWLERWLTQRPAWRAYTAQDWDAMWQHVSSADFPETDADWRRLGREAGFAHTRLLFTTPTDLFRLYCFSGRA